MTSTSRERSGCRSVSASSRPSCSPSAQRPAQISDVGQLGLDVDAGPVVGRRQSALQQRDRCRWVVVDALLGDRPQCDGGRRARLVGPTQQVGRDSRCGVADRAQLLRRLEVQGLAQRKRLAVVHRLAHQVVPERQPRARLRQDVRLDRVAQERNQLDGRPAGDDRQLADVELRAQHRGDAQQLDAATRQEAEPPQRGQVKRPHRLRPRGVDHAVPALERALLLEHRNHLDDEERVAGGAAHGGQQPLAGPPAERRLDKRPYVAVLERPERQVIVAELVE